MTFNVPKCYAKRLGETGCVELPLTWITTECKKAGGPIECVVRFPYFGNIKASLFMDRAVMDDEPILFGAEMPDGTRVLCHGHHVRYHFTTVMRELAYRFTVLDGFVELEREAA